MTKSSLSSMFMSEDSVSTLSDVTAANRELGTLLQIITKKGREAVVLMSTCSRDWLGC